MSEHLEKMNPSEKEEPASPVAQTKPSTVDVMPEVKFSKVGELHTAVMQQQLTVQTHSGPLPPPEVFNQYDPEARKYWMEMIRESRHDASERATQAQSDTFKINRMGRHLGFWFALVCVLGSFALAALAISLCALHLIDDAVCNFAIKCCLYFAGAIGSTGFLSVLITGISTLTKGQSSQSSKN